MASHRHTRSQAATNKDMMESFRAMARAIREQAAGMAMAMDRWTMSI